LEGSYRINRKEFKQFTGISRGSAGELKYHLLVAKDLGYISTPLTHALHSLSNAKTRPL